MKMNDTEVNQGGLMRCCLETIHQFAMEDVEREVEEGHILDCKYEKPGNKRIILQNGAWRWNKEGSVW